MTLSSLARIRYLRRCRKSALLNYLGVRRLSKFVYPEGMTSYEDDYAESPTYPEINPETRKLTDKQRDIRDERLKWYDKIKLSTTCEEKVLNINIPRKYGWHCDKVNEDRLFYDSQTYYRFITRTNFISESSLSSVFTNKLLEEKAKHYASKLKSQILEAIKFEVDGRRRNISDEENITSEADIDVQLSQSYVNQINRVLINELAQEAPHLQDYEIDYSPKIESFWSVYGFPLDVFKEKKRESLFKAEKWRKTSENSALIKEDDPMESKMNDKTDDYHRNIQYTGIPLLQLRWKNPLPYFVDPDHVTCSKGPEVKDEYPYEPVVYQIHSGTQHASYIPGHWSSDDFNYSILSLHGRQHLLQNSFTRSQQWFDDKESTLTSQGILASFGKLLAQAMHLGFDQFTDLDYPLTTGTILTDGFNWSFFAYQLNTISLGRYFMHKNKKQNLCWGTETKSLLTPNGEDINSETLELILKFYLNKPCLKNPVSNPMPFIGDNLSSMEDESKREIIFHNYRLMLTQKQNLYDSLLSRRLPEIMDWERIYKILFKQRPRDKKNRFFELPIGIPGADPYKEEYKLLDPNFIYRTKGYKRLKALLDTRREEERVKAAKFKNKLGKPDSD